MSRISRSKFMIDYENKHRECGTCRLVLPFSSFSVYPDGLIYTDCKPCRSEKQTRKYGEKKLKAYPDRYHQCSNEDCNWVWAKSRGEPCVKCGARCEINLEMEVLQ